MSTSVEIVLPGNVLDDWGSIEPLIAKFCSKSSGRYVVTDVMRLLLQGEWDIWVVRRDGVVTLVFLGWVVRYPQLLAYEPIAVVGQYANDWLDALPRIERWAKDRGCSLGIVTAPRGWSKLLSKHGYGATHEVLVKEL